MKIRKSMKMEIFKHMSLDNAIILSVEEVVEQLDGIMESYGEGSDQLYLIDLEGDGKRRVVLSPYDGPYQAKVEKLEDEYIVRLPERIIAKSGLKYDEEVEIICEKNSIIVRRKEDANQENN